MTRLTACLSSKRRIFTHQDLQEHARYACAVPLRRKFECLDFERDEQSGSLFAWASMCIGLCAAKSVNASKR